MTRIRTISMAESTGALRETYQAMMARPLPPVYRPLHGDAPGIIRAHSLDAGWMRTTFAISGTLHLPGADGGALTWHQRELLAAATSRTNQCRY